MVEILGVPFSTKTFEETYAQLEQALGGDVPLHIVTANPEIVMIARENQTVRDLLHEADLVTPDGIGAVWASKYYGHAISGRVTGAELSSALIEHCAKQGLRVYLLGAKPESNRLAQKKLREKYPNLQIAGRDGYFGADEEAKVVEEVRQFAPHLLLVGLGMPRQELFISTYKKTIGARVNMGIGGVIDIFAGTVKRAPKLFRDLHLEWFYRLASQPSRWRRQLVLPQFVLTVLTDKNRKQ